MGLIPLEKFSINRFWENTPTALKYILIITVLIATSYFVIAKKLDENHLVEIQTMRHGITATYELIDNFESFRDQQGAYNEEVIRYLKNLHTLVDELNISTNRKLDMILSSGTSNTEDIIEKIMLLNESFEKISKIYQNNIEVTAPRYEIGVRPQNNRDE